MKIRLDCFDELWKMVKLTVETDDSIGNDCTDDLQVVLANSSDESIRVDCFDELGLIPTPQNQGVV